MNAKTSKSSLLPNDSTFESSADEESHDEKEFDDDQLFVLSVNDSKTVGTTLCSRVSQVCAKPTSNARKNFRWREKLCLRIHIE